MVFVACERVLINQEDNTASLIGILQGFTLPSVPAEGETNALPMTWYAYMQWDRGSDVRSQYDYRAELKNAAGKTLAGANGTLSISNADRRFHRLMCKFVGFPIDGVGDYALSLALLEHGKEVFTAHFPVPVTAL
jgi:hypothetical protein